MVALNGPLEERFPGLRGLPRPVLMFPVAKPDSLGACPVPHSSPAPHPRLASLPSAGTPSGATAGITCQGPEAHPIQALPVLALGPQLGAWNLTSIWDKHPWDEVPCERKEEGVGWGPQSSHLRAHRGADMLWTGRGRHKVRGQTVLVGRHTHTALRKGGSPSYPHSDMSAVARVLAAFQPLQMSDPC